MPDLSCSVTARKGHAAKALWKRELQKMPPTSLLKHQQKPMYTVPPMTAHLMMNVIAGLTA